MTLIETHKKLFTLVAEKRRIELWAKRRGNEFFYTYDEKSKLRSINEKIDRILESQPKEATPQKLF